MTPQEIADKAADEIFTIHVETGLTGRCEVQAAALILSAAAKMVQQSGAEAAMRLASLNYKRTNHSNPEMMMDDEHEAWTAIDAALTALRTLTEHKP